MGWLNDTNTGSYSPFTPGVSVGLRNVGSYQVSGHPYLTGSILDSNSANVRFSFPYVTKKIKVMNTGSGDTAFSVHFVPTSAGGGADKFEVSKHSWTVYPMSSSDGADAPPGVVTAGLWGQHSVAEFDVKCKEIYVSIAGDGDTGGVQIYASLTNIPTQRMYVLTGSGLTTSDGS